MQLLICSLMVSISVYIRNIEFKIEQKCMKTLK